jgi:hypothetical protein
MKRILFSIPYGLAFRAVVSAGLVEQCVKQGHQVRVLLPPLAPSDRPRIHAQLADGVEVGELRRVPRSLRVSVLKFLKQHLYYQRTASQTFATKRRERRRSRPVFHAFASAAEQAGAWLTTEAQLDRWLSGTRQPFEAEYACELEGVDAVAITKPGYHPDDLPLIRAAKQRAVPVISVDTTWDNIVSKRPAYIPPDVLTVWNEGMQDEVVAFYGLDRQAVPITGGPQFDVFFRRDRLPDRATFVRSIGLDPDRPLIVLALNSPTLTPGNPLFVAAVADAVATAGRGANLAIRLHPGDRDGDYRHAVAGHKGVMVEHAFGRPSPESAFECLPTADDVVHYGALISHADVVINIASTATLDAIAADRPPISLAFDPAPVAPELSTARYCEFTHFRALIDTGAVSIARSSPELSTLLSENLRNPGALARERAKARAQFLTFCDAESGTRVVSAIAKVATEGRSERRLVATPLCAS